MKNKKDTTGFGISGVLISILILTGIGMAGWYVFQLQHRTQDSSTKTNAVNQTEISESSKESDSSVVSEAPLQEGYLVIKEWGIKLPLTESTADAYYVASNNSQSDGKPNAMWLGLKSLDAAGCAVPQSGTGGLFYPIGVIIKVKPDETDPVTGVLVKEQDPNGVEINGYYYAFHSGITGSSPNRCILKIHDVNTKQIDADFRAKAKVMSSE